MKTLRERVDLTCAVLMIVLIAYISWYGFNRRPKIELPKYYIIGLFDGEVGLTVGPFDDALTCNTVANEYQKDVNEGQFVLKEMPKEQRTEIQISAMNMKIEIECVWTDKRPKMKIREG